VIYLFHGLRKISFVGLKQSFANVRLFVCCVFSLLTYVVIIIICDVLLGFRTQHAGARAPDSPFSTVTLRRLLVDRKRHHSVIELGSRFEKRVSSACVAFFLCESEIWENVSSTSSCVLFFLGVVLVFAVWLVGGLVFLVQARNSTLSVNPIHVQNLKIESQLFLLSIHSIIQST
jgi:hypothetical protein